MKRKPLQIAIDGPVASGKGEIAARLAKKYNLLYVYTGAMYRALALKCIAKGVSTNDEAGVLATLNHMHIDMLPPPVGSAYPFCVLLEGKDVTTRIHQQDTAQGASDVGVIPGVRQWMVVRQQELAQGVSVVVEGRDIALRVLPQADLKIYLTASLEERAKRRYLQWKERGMNKTPEETHADTETRDYQDMNRHTDPLRKTPDAWELDTTGMTPEETVAAIDSELHKRGLV